MWMHRRCSSRYPLLLHPHPPRPHRHRHRQRTHVIVIVIVIVLVRPLLPEAQSAVTDVHTVLAHSLAALGSNDIAGHRAVVAAVVAAVAAALWAEQSLTLLSNYAGYPASIHSSTFPNRVVMVSRCG